MQTIVSCDRVFDALTRQPFPAGKADDMMIEAHLLACHDCRRLAEALRPAVDLLRESLDDRRHNSLYANASGRLSSEHKDGVTDFADDQVAQLPQFTGFSNEDSAVESIMLQIHEASLKATTEPVLPSTLDTVAGRDISGIGFAALPRHPWIACGLAIIALLGFFLVAQFATNLPNGTLGPFSNDGERHVFLSGVGVPVACLTKVGLRSPIELSNSEDPAELTWHGKNHGTHANVCCTQCHHGAPDRSMDRLPVKNSPLGIESIAKSCGVCHVMQD